MDFILIVSALVACSITQVSIIAQHHRMHMSVQSRTLPCVKSYFLLNMCLQVLLVLVVYMIFFRMSLAPGTISICNFSDQGNLPIMAHLDRYLEYKFSFEVFACFNFK